MRTGPELGEGRGLGFSGHHPGPSYDAVYILANALERAKTIEPDAVVSALETIWTVSWEGSDWERPSQVVYGVNPKETALGSAFQWKKPGVRVPVQKRLPKERLNFLLI